MFDIIARINTVEGIITPCVREDFSRYRRFVSSCECEICHQKRRRDSLVVIREEDGTEKVAGLGCLRRLYGKDAVSNANRVASDGEAHLKEFFVNVELYVNMADDIHKLRGFISKKMAMESENNLVPNFELLAGWKEWPTSREYTKIKAYFDKLELTTDFIFSAKNLLSMEWATEKAIPMIPAIVNAYYKFLEDDLRKAELKVSTKAYGKAGDKFKGSLKAKVIGKKTVYGQGFSYYDNGERLAYVFKTENNELIYWKTSEPAYWEINVGDEFVLKSFRVKNHFLSKVYGNVATVTYLKME